MYGLLAHEVIQQTTWRMCEWSGEGTDPGDNYVTETKSRHHMNLPHFSVLLILSPLSHALLPFFIACTTIPLPFFYFLVPHLFKFHFSFHLMPPNTMTDSHMSLLCLVEEDPPPKRSLSRLSLPRQSVTPRTSSRPSTVLTLTTLLQTSSPSRASPSSTTFKALPLRLMLSTTRQC